MLLNALFSSAFSVCAPPFSVVSFDVVRSDLLDFFAGLLGSVVDEEAKADSVINVSSVY
jgi:hypothetical protein